MDHASFDFEVLGECIWGLSAPCVLSGIRPTEYHHVKSRGNAKDKENRKMHSSVFNAAPLSHAVHAFAPLHDPDLESFLLRYVNKRVMYAVAQGTYELTEVDMAFRKAYPLYPATT